MVVVLVEEEVDVVAAAEPFGSVEVSTMVVGGGSLCEGLTLFHSHLTLFFTCLR